MASQPSLYSEERKLLRIQAWEQRNQEVCQEKKGHAENVPLFGKPYKTSRWDELSSRVQGMLGSYDDGRDPDLNTGNFVKDLLGSSSSHASIIAQLDQRQLTPVRDAAKPSFHSGTRPPTPSTLTESLARRSVCPPPGRNQHGAPPAVASAGGPSPSYAQEEEEEARTDACSPRVQDEEDLLDMEYTRLPRMLSTLSPLARMESPLHSSDGDHPDHPRDAGGYREGFDLRPDSLRRPLVSPIRPLEEVGGSEPSQPPEDARLPPAAKGGAGPPPQTFPPPLASGMVVTRKPTAYVRPMDGQDQVIMESPELKPSPESYEPIPDKGSHHHGHHHHHHHRHHNNINSNHGPLSKSLPRNPETRPNDAQCVEDILREMTHSWPPLLTTIQTPSASPTPRSPPPDKVVERVQVKPPDKEHYDSPPTVSSVSSQQSSACAVEPAHSSGVESASSSDSESSSESENESPAPCRPPAQPTGGSPAEVKTTAPHGVWQLANWIRSGQQNAACATQSPPHKPPPPLDPSPRSSSGPRDAAAGPSAPGPPRSTRDYKPDGPSAQDQPCHGTPAKPRPAKSSGKTACKKNSAKAGRTLSPGPPGAAPRAEPAPTEDKPATSSSSFLTFSYRPKVKTKTKRSSSSSGAGRAKAESSSLPRQKRPLACAPKEPASASACPCGKFPPPCACPAVPGRQPGAPSAEVSGLGGGGGGCERVKRPKPPRKAPKTVKSHAAPQPPGKPATPATLLVKIELSLLCRVPQQPAVRQETTSSVTSTNHQSALTTTNASTSSTGPSGPSATPGSSRGKGVSEKGGKGSQPNKWGPTKNNNKRPAETDNNPPKKKQKMEKKAKAVDPLPDPATIKSEGAIAAVKEEKQKTARKRSVPRKQQHCSEPKEQRTDGQQSRDTNPNPKHKKNPKKHREHPKTGKKAPRSILTGQASAEPSRTPSSRTPLLRFEDRLYPVKHYIKEAKKLKHKADAEADKVSKAFGYLEAAMFFAESGVAMETEPESPYSMYEDTVELIKFTLKQKNSGETSALPSENDFTVLCLRCQAFLQMAMFRCKHKVASKYSKTLKTHFNNSKPSLDASLGSSRSADAASPRSNVASPAIGAPSSSSTTSSSSSGPGSNHSCGGGEGPGTTSTSTTVSIPKIIHHVAFSYVNITALFVSAHDLWEKAEAMANASSGVLSELNAHMEPLSLSSSMKAMVQYTRQALHWLRPDAQSTKST